MAVLTMKVNYRKKQMADRILETRLNEQLNLSTSCNTGTNNWTIVYCNESQGTQLVMSSNAYWCA